MKTAQMKLKVKRMTEEIIKSNTTLIICPASLMGQWEREVVNKVIKGFKKAASTYLSIMATKGSALRAHLPDMIL